MSREKALETVAMYLERLKSLVQMGSDSNWRDEWHIYKDDVEEWIKKTFEEDSKDYREIHQVLNPEFVLAGTDPYRDFVSETKYIRRSLALVEHRLMEGHAQLLQEPAAAALATEDVHTILFTDMEGSTTLTERLGDAGAQELRRTHDSIVRDALKARGGSETKHTGDGIMASFPSASRAIECAIAVQRAIAAHGETLLRVRIGLNAGEPVAEDEDLFGTAVNLARRICDHAEPGQILVSDVVQQLAAGKGFTFADKGEATLKGFEKPVRLHEVRWQDDS